MDFSLCKEPSVNRSSLSGMKCRLTLYDLEIRSRNQKDDAGLFSLPPVVL